MKAYIMICDTFISLCLLHVAACLRRNCSRDFPEGAGKAATAADPTTLLFYLTQSCYYDKYTTPATDHPDKPFEVRIRMHIYYITYEQSENLEFKVQLLVQIRWKDARLAYDDIQPDSPVISGELNFADKIWTPNIYLANERSPLIGGKHNKNVMIHITPDGTVKYTTRLKTTIFCWTKLGRFPFDRQKCHLNVDTWKFSSNDLVLKWEEDENGAVSITQGTPFLVEYQLEHLENMADFEYTEADAISKETYYNCSTLTVTFVMAREYGFYVMDYYVPSVLLVCISWVTFWAAPDSTPGRTLLGTGTMLTFISLGVDVGKSLPNVAYIRSNDVWFIGCTAFIFCSLAEFAFVNTIWRYGGKVKLKKETSKYILKSSLQVKPIFYTFRRQSVSCPSTPPSLRHKWIQPPDNERTVKSLSELDLSLPMSELKTAGKDSFKIAEAFAVPTTMTAQEIAIWIDKKSRIAFPVCFILFNAIYWSFLSFAST